MSAFVQRLKNPSAPAPVPSEEPTEVEVPEAVKEEAKPAFSRA